MNGENEFLSSYNIEDYKRPSLAADIAIFTIKSTDSSNYRKLPLKKLNILLIKRGEYPFKDYFALPGGFLRDKETVENTAIRELKEETGVENVFLRQMGVFSDIGRDPRGWIISNAFLALIDGENVELKSKNDADDAMWFEVEYNLVKENKEITKDGFIKTEEYQLKLVSEDKEIIASIRKNIIFKGYTKTCSYDILSSKGIAFDHAKIIANAIEELRWQTENSTIAFNLLPELFTLTDLQKIYEIVLDKELYKANFRRQMSDYLIPTEEMTENSGHRPSRLYKRNIDKFV